MKFTQKLLLIILAFSFNSCDITKILDPANTTYQLISFRLDGKKWIPGANGATTANGSLVEGLVIKDVVFISAFRADAPKLNPNKFVEEEFSMNIFKKNTTGTFDIAKEEVLVTALYRIRNAKGDITSTYKLNPKLGGTIKIEKLQLENDFAQGEFSFYLEEVDTHEKLKVSKGSFAISTTDFFYR